MGARSEGGTARTTPRLPVTWREAPRAAPAPPTPASDGPYSGHRAAGRLGSGAADSCSRLGQPPPGRLLALQEQTARKGPQEVCKSARERVSVCENEGAGAGLKDCAQPCVGELSVSGCTRVCVAQWVSVGVRVNRCK